MGNKILMIDLMQVEYNNRALLEAQTLIRNGFDVALLGFTYNKTYYGKSKINGVDCYAYGLFKGRLGLQRILRFISALWLLLRIYVRTLVYKADYYHAHNFQVLIPAFFSSLIHKKVLIYDSHEIWTHHKNKKIALEHILAFIVERVCSNSVDALIGTNELMTEFIKKKYSIKKSISIYNTPNLITNIINQKLFHKYFAFGEEDKVILFQGGLWSTGRPIFEIIDAAKFLPKNVKIVLLGYSSETFINKIKEYIGANSLEKQVFIHPPQTGKDLLYYTKSADIGLNLIKGNNVHQEYQCTWKLFEYCMVGIPVISSNHKFNKWIHEMYEIGLIVDPESSEEIASAIKSILENENDIERFKQNTVMITQNYNWSNQAKKLVSLYELF